MQTNYYRLSKKELSFISSIEAPIVSILGNRLSRPVVVVRSSREPHDIIHVWSLHWFRFWFKQPGFISSYIYEIHAMY